MEKVGSGGHILSGQCDRGTAPGSGEGRRCRTKRQWALHFVPTRAMDLARVGNFIATRFQPFLTTFKNGLGCAGVL